MYLFHRGCKKQPQPRIPSPSHVLTSCLNDEISNRLKLKVVMGLAISGHPWLGLVALSCQSLVIPLLTLTSRLTQGFFLVPSIKSIIRS